MKSKQFFCLRNLIISFAVLMFMNILINNSPVGLSRLVEITGGHSILDMEFRGYSAERAYEILDALGDEGRAFNMKYIIPLDFPFPLAYGMFYFITLTLIWKNVGIKTKRPWVIGLVGLCAALFDWSENIAIINLLNSYPQRNYEIAKIANIFTQLKTLCMVLSILLIVVGLITLAVKWLKVKMTTNLAK